MRGDRERVLQAFVTLVLFMVILFVATRAAGDPALLIADEPTTALDVTIQAQIIDLLERLKRERSMAGWTLAGSFGYQAGDPYEVSVAAGERVLFPAVRAASDSALVVADGFSCRAQIASGTGRRALHSAQVLQRALAASA